MAMKYKLQNTRYVYIYRKDKRMIEGYEKEKDIIPFNAIVILLLQF